MVRERASDEGTSVRKNLLINLSLIFRALSRQIRGMSRDVSSVAFYAIARHRGQKEMMVYFRDI